MLQEFTKIQHSLTDFLAESNEIEGIYKTPSLTEIKQLDSFLRLDKLTVEDLVKFVQDIQPKAKLRAFKHLNVKIGEHLPPKGGIKIVLDLETLLNKANKILTNRALDAYLVVNHAVKDFPDYSKIIYSTHNAYETLHPFTDGNGRSGRAIWLWQMIQYGLTDGGQLPQLGFLHTYYYQALNASRSK